MTHTLKRLGVKAVVALGLGLGAWMSSEGQSLRWLGTLPGYVESQASDVTVTSSGTVVVVGTCYDRFGTPRGFHWVNNSMRALPPLSGGSSSSANGVSADGTFVVGTSDDPSTGDSRAVRWTVGTTITTLNLGRLGSSFSEGRGISSNGNVIVGITDTSGGDYRGFRWENNSWRNLGTFSQGTFSEAYAVSGDGVIVVGVADNSSGYYRAFRWSNTERVLRELGTLSGGTESMALGISPDGSTIVGTADNADGLYRAFRWTQSGGMQNLGTISDSFETSAYDASNNGAVVVGSAIGAIERAIRWTASGGLEDLNIVYAALLRNGSVLLSATAVSADGRYIVGYGYNAATRRVEAFLLDTQGGTPPPRADINGDGCVNDADLLEVLFSFGTGCGGN